MEKINDWNSVEPANVGEFKKLPPGGYICKIVNIELTKSKKGNDMLVLWLDITQGEYANFFKEAYQNDTRDEKKWSCKYYQLVEGESIKFFKGLITSIEKSNPGYVWDFDEKGLVGKLMGGVFGEEEYEKQDGTISTITKIFYPRSVDEIKNGVDIPKPKTIEKTQSNSSASYSNTDESDLPF